MKTTRNIFGALLVLTASLSWTACDDEAEYTPAEVPDNTQVYFPSTNSATIELSITATSFNVPIMRVKTNEAQSVSITATGGDNHYTIPSSASFGQGENSANITIGYNPDELEYDSFSEITLKISDESVTTPYGASEYTFQVGISAPWTSLGMCTFSDYFLFENSYKVELQQNELNPNLFRLVDPYSEGLEKEEYTSNGDQSEYVEFTVLKPGDKIHDVTVTMEGLVYFSAYCTGFYNTSYDANVDAHHPSDFTSFQDESTWTFSKVVSYQENNLPAVVQLAPYYYMNGIGGWDYTQYDDVIRIVFPGVVEADYALSVAYGGKYTDAKGDDAGVVARLTEAGADLESIRLAVVAGNDVAQAVEGIRNGNIESVEAAPEAGAAVMVPFASAPETGVYTLVAVGYAGNVAQASASASFKYTNAPAETWTAVGTGDYLYTLLFADSEDEPYLDEGLTLYRSDDTPNRYKIEHWGYDVDFVFTYDEATGRVMVEDQETGYVHPQYGTVFVDDLVDYSGGTQYGESYYEDGVFHFAVIYYVSQGDFGYGEETFTLTGNAASSISAARTPLAPQARKSARQLLSPRRLLLRQAGSPLPAR